jgi:hypothetical protein
MRRSAESWLLLAISLVALTAGGCCPGYVRVTLRADAETNQGRPLRVLVRSVEENQHRSESYDAVSQLVIQPDASVLKTLLLDPRRRSRSFWVKSDKDKPLGIYFLYTAPTSSWKVWLRPELSWRVNVKLGRSGVGNNAVSEYRVFRRYK